MNEHSEAFAEVRQAVLDLDESDRKRIAAMLGAMTVPEPALSGQAIAFLAKFSALPENDRYRLSAWFGKYVNRWGQIPVMAGRGVVSDSPHSD